MLARKLRNWVGLPRAEQSRALEAAILLGAAWAAVRLLPFAVYSRSMGRPGPAVEPRPVDATGVGPMARDVNRALRRASRHLPWHSTCLMRAVAGQVMLRRRRCPGTVFVGVGRSEGGDHVFHAWLLAGEFPVTGASESRRFSVIATFR